MTGPANIVDSIILKRKDLTRDEVLSLIQRKKDEAGGLLSDEGAARLVEEDLGSHGGFNLAISDLSPGMNDIAVAGRVLNVSDIIEFSNGGRSGCLLRLVLADRTGRLACVIWNDKARSLSQTGDLLGKIARISHGYTREGLKGGVEVHCGDRSQLDLLESENEDNRFLKLEELLLPLSSLTEPGVQVSTFGRVSTPPKTTTFSTNNRSGKVLRTVLTDGQSYLSLSAWDQRADELSHLKRGDVLALFGAILRFDKNGQLGLHIDTRAQWKIVDLETTPFDEKSTIFHRIVDLQPDAKNVNVRLRVLEVGGMETIRRRDGTVARVGRLLLCDDSGIIQASFWGDQSSIVESAKRGDEVTLLNARVEQRLNALGLAVGAISIVEVKPESEISTPIPPIKPLPPSRISETNNLTVVRGRVFSPPSLREIKLSSGESVELATVEIGDDTGRVKALFWRSLASKVKELTAGQHVTIWGCTVRRGVDGMFELSSTSITRVETLDDPTETVKFEHKPVITLKQGQKARVKGTIVKVLGDVKLTATCEKCNTKFEFSREATICPFCQQPYARQAKISARFLLDDGTGVIETELSEVDAAHLQRPNSVSFGKELTEEVTANLGSKSQLPERLAGMMIETSGECFENLGTRFFKAHDVKVIFP